METTQLHIKEKERYNSVRDLEDMKKRSFRQKKTQANERRNERKKKQNNKRQEQIKERRNERTNNEMKKKN